MRLLVAVMPAYMRQSVATMLQYRGEIVLWAVWGVVYPLVAMAAMSDAVRGSPSGEDIQGFTPRDFAAYFLVTMIVGHICVCWDIYEMGYLVRSGQMSPRLLRPILPIWNSVADNLAYKSVTLVILVPTWLLVAWLAQPRFDTTGLHLLAGVPAVILAAALNYLWGYNLALCAFWWTRMDGVSESWWGLSLLFGGRLFPIEIMPVALQWFAAVLPFKWVIWFPTATLMGRLSPQEVAVGLLWQVGWLAAGLLVFRVGWRFAVKRYSAVGN